MGTITESFSNLTELLLNQKTRSQGSAATSAGSEFLISRWLKPVLPSAVRCSQGVIVDVKDRQIGPFDVIGCLEAYPIFGEGAASTFLSDGVIFCLQARNWAVSDLTEFGEMAAQLKKLEGERSFPLICAAVAFDALSLEHVAEFLKSPGGQAVDAVLSLGNNLTIRNTQAWYGDPKRVPYVTERGAAEALKAFTFFLIQLAQNALGIPFGLASYQHL